MGTALVSSIGRGREARYEDGITHAHDPGPGVSWTTTLYCSATVGTRVRHTGQSQSRGSHVTLDKLPRI